MKKIFLFLGGSALLTVGALHLVVSSGPVQKRILDKIKAALAGQGIEISIESVDFSFLSPRIYLNRVTLRTNERAEVQLEKPIEIDKIKVEFQPLGLIRREIVLDEVALFHPKIIIARADQLYQKVVTQLDKKKPIEVQGKGWPLVLRRVGIIDSQFDVQAAQPKFSIVSRSLTVFFSQAAQGQQTIEAKSTHVEIGRGKLALFLSNLDADVDMTDQSVRINRLQLEGEGVKLQWKGACTLPSGTEKTIPSFHLAHETEVDLALLNQVEELNLPILSGYLKSSGTLHVAKDSYSGTGSLELEKFELSGNRLGNWKTDYGLDPKELKFSDIQGAFSNGQIKAPKIKVGLTSGYPLEAEIILNGIELNEVFQSLQLKDVPVHLGLEGNIRVTGHFEPKLSLVIEPRLKGKDFWVLNKSHLGKTSSNQVLFVPLLETKGNIQVSSDTVELTSSVSVLGGNLDIGGRLENGTGRISFQGKDLSLSQLKKIAEINFRGNTSLNGEINVAKNDVNVQGQFEINQASISDLELGSVKGRVQYRGDLLSFSKLEIRAIDVVRGQGHVDFSPKETQYRFDINLPRMGMEQLLKVFSRTPLPVQNPTGGEVAARVIIEGGLDDLGIDVRVDGQARSFEWYGEKWMSAGFGLRYRPDSFVVQRGVFLKRSGSLEVKAQYDKKVKQLTFFSSGLRLEDLNHLGQSPVQGEVTGRLVFEGEMNYPRGNGELSISKLQFREKKVSDAHLVLKSLGDKSEYWLTFEKETFKGHLLRKEKEEVVWSQLDMNCDSTDLAPYLSAWMGKDISPLNQVLVTGNWKMEGDFSKPSSISGTAQLQKLKLGFEGRPLEADDDIQIKIHQGGVEIPRIRLSGSGNEIQSEISIVPNQAVEVRASGKLNLDFFQPFIPGLDYASGLVNANCEVTGTPQKFNLFGNISISDSAFRIAGMNDEFRNVNAQLNLSEDKITFERFQGNLGGGDVSIGGDIQIGRFTRFSPSLNLFVSKVNIHPKDYLNIKLTGELLLKAVHAPYRLSGNVKLDEVLITKLDSGPTETRNEQEEILTFDIKADAKENLFIRTDVIDAEFKGDFRLLGGTQGIGLLGKTEVIKGKVFFKDTPFDLVSGLARFEREEEIYPQFNVTGRSLVREQKGRAYQDYEVNLQVLGTPDDYKIRLTSNPPLVEQDLISLLVLGVTSRGQEGNYFDLGTAIMGQSPIKSKLQSELGVDIKVQSTPSQTTPGSTVGTGTSTAGTGSVMVPAVRIEKGLSRKTKISYSNTLDTNQTRELRLEQMLDENITLNATAGDRSRNNTTARPGDSFGLDVRYRFDFE